MLFLIDYWPIKATFGWEPGRNKIFGDLSMALRMMECSDQYGIGIYTFDNPGGCSGYTYGYLFARMISFLGIGPDDASFIGYIFIVIIVMSSAVFAWFSANQLNIRKFLIVAIFFSPPFWLAVAAPNFDSLVLFLLLLAVIAERKHSSTLALTLVAISSLIKFFTLPLLILLFILTLIRKDKRHFDKIYSFLVTLVVMISTIHDARLVDWSNPNYRMATGIFHVFGLQSPANWLKVGYLKITSDSLELSSVAVRLIGLFSIFICLFLVLLVARNELNPISFKTSLTSTFNRDNHKTRIILLYLGIPYLSVFFQGQNYDSKLIFFAFCLTTATFLVANNHLHRRLTYLGLLSIWLSCFWPKWLPATSFFLIQAIGDFGNFLATASLIIQILLLFSRNRIETR